MISLLNECFEMYYFFTFYFFFIYFLFIYLFSTEAYIRI